MEWRFHWGFLENVLKNSFSLYESMKTSCIMKEAEKIGKTMNFEPRTNFKKTYKRKCQ